MSNVQSGHVVLTPEGEYRVVVDVQWQDAAPGEEEHAVNGHVHMAALRRTDEDPLREVDSEGGDIEITGEYADLLKITGHI